MSLLATTTFPPPTDMSLHGFLVAFRTDPVVAGGVIFLLLFWSILGGWSYWVIRHMLVSWMNVLIALACGPVAWALAILGAISDRVLPARKAEDGTITAGRLINHPSTHL